MKTTYLDVQLQYRNGFYLVMIIVLIASLLVISQLPSGMIVLILPIFILSNLISGTFLFMGALILFEKDQSIPTALNVTPLTPHEYLISKVTTLTLLGFFEGGSIILYIGIILNVNLNSMNLLIGLGLLALLYCLTGFSTVVKYQDFNGFMSKGILIGGIMTIPFINFFTDNIVVQSLLYIIPTNAALVLMTQPALLTWFSIFNLGINLLWIILLFKFGINSYSKFYENRRGIS